MRGIDFENRTLVLGAPPDWKEGDCYGLPVAQTMAPLPSGELTPVLISCWKLSPEEIEEVTRTGVVYLQICGVGMSPVSVYGISPFPDNYDKEAALALHNTFVQK